jgi:hypothetical protein
MFFKLKLLIKFALRLRLTTNQKRTLLLFAIFLVALLFRVVIIFHNEYPPSTDIGLHSNILNLILDENKLPDWNPYHMGGEPLTTPPGYHLFAAFIVLFTGMPIIVAQMIIAAFFSSFVVFPAYLFSKRMWKSASVGFLAAFLVAVSSFSLEMLGWGGYLNVVSLLLIAIIYYLFLKNKEHPNSFNLIPAALLFGCLILTHLLSFFVLFSVLILYIILLWIDKALKHVKTENLNFLRFFSITTALGILVASPWLLRVWSFYFEMASQGVFFGGLEENRDLLLFNRYIEVNILILVGAVVLMFFMFRASRGKYVDSESLLLIVWYLVPLVLTQSYVVGIVTDYTRFIYFADFPSLIILSAAIFYLFGFVSITIKKIVVGKWIKYQRIVSTIAFPAILLVLYLILPLATTPMQAAVKADFYTTIEKPEANAMKWIQQRTEDSAIIVADHLYGWWLSGITQRTTLSAVDPEFLLYPNEIEVAKSALFLLDTDYYIDNGLIQVLEDGGYIARRNPVFGIETTRGYSYHIFHFSDEETTIYFKHEKTRETLDLFELEVNETCWISRDNNSAILRIIRENDLLKVEKKIEVYRGVRFARLSYEIRTGDNETSIDWLRLILHTVEGNVVFNQSMLGLYDPYEKVCGQMIFKENYPEVKMYTSGRMGNIELLYTNKEDSFIKIEILVGVFDAAQMTYQEVLEVYDEFLLNPQQILTNLPTTTWDYLESIKSYNISYVICRENYMYPKFSNDPNFQVVYNNIQLAIFKVIEHK